MTPSEQIAALLEVDERIKLYKHCDHDPAKLTDKMLSYNRGIDAALNVVEYSLPTVRQMVKDIGALRKTIIDLEGVITVTNAALAMPSGELEQKIKEILTATAHYESIEI